MVYEKDLTKEEVEALIVHYKKNKHELYNALLDDDIVLTWVDGHYLPIRADGTVECIYSDKTKYNVPRQLVEEMCVTIDGNLYLKNSPLLCETQDTERLVLRENAIKAHGGYWYENECEDIMYLDRHDMWFRVKDLATAHDTGELHPRMELNRSERDGKLYRYTRLALPMERWGRAPYVNEVIFPKDIDERRIGVEFEFGNTFTMFKPFLQSHHKYNWQSVRDGSLDDIAQGIEFVSRPFKLDELSEVHNFLEFSKESDAIVNNKCGFHVHIGASDLSFLDISRLVALACSLESEMFILGGSDRKKNRYCKSLDARFEGFSDIVLPKDKNAYGHALYEGQRANFQDRHNQSKYVDARDYTGIRYYWFNIDRFFYKRNQPEQKTVEFRNHMATFDASRFCDFALLCYYIVEFAKTHSKETCQQAKVMDVIKTSQLRHRKQLINYVNKYL